MKTMGYPDKPVSNINEDLFNVEVYVNALCSFIRSCETPMTISVQGDWGSGKTSLMNMMMANLQGSVWPIWFNTWQFSQFDMGHGLVFSMMDVILKGLDCEKSLRRKIISGLIGFGKRAVRNVSDYTFGGEITNVISHTIDGGVDIDVASCIIDLKDQFLDAINAKLEKEHRDRVVIFVDDLDRLQPAKAIELLEVLKLFLDCDRCVFVLAVDYEVVTLGIKQKFGNDVSKEKGRSFFDKIIQLPFKVPVANYDIHKYVRDMMQQISETIDDKEVGLYYDLIQSSVGFNPRSMKRLFNTFELLDIVTESTVNDIEEGLRRRILFAIICTQMCFEKLYMYFTSTRIDEDSFKALRNEHVVNDTLKEIYGLTPSQNTTEEIERIKKFLPHFFDALQTDSDHGLSGDELKNFTVILKCSVVTSINNISDNLDANGQEWNYRNKNKELVKEAAEMLTDIGKFTLWMPRKEREGVKYSDVSGWYAWNTELGFDVSFEYYLSRISEYTIGVNVFISLRNGKGMEVGFFKALGDNPLRLAIIPQREDWGRYRYNNLLRLNANDQSAADQIASLVSNSLASLKETLDEYRNTHEGLNNI